MSSPNDVASNSNAEDRLQLPAGEGAIVAVGAAGTVFERLPAETENLLVVSSDAPGDVAEVLSATGRDLASVGMIPVSGGGVEYDGPMAVSDPVVPDDLTGLSMRFTRAIDALSPGEGWVVFDRLNVLFLYADEGRVMRFLDHVAGVARDRELRCLFCVVRDAVDERTYAKLKRRVDREIDPG